MRTPCTMLGLFVAATLAAACASTTPGAQPHDMSVAGHEHAAEAADTEAAKHAGEYDPQAVGAKSRCAGLQKDTGSQPCWTEDTNTSQEHLAAAERSRKAAADHRAASQALRDAEAAACGGLAESDRDTSPLLHAGDVTAVEEVRTTSATKTVMTTNLAGAAVTIRAVPGLTKEYLQRLVNCHIARNSSMGHAMPEMAACPLAVKGAAATVESGNGAFVVRVTGDDATAAAEILKRAKSLAPAAAH